MGDELKDARVEAKVAKAKAKALRPFYAKKRYWVLAIVAIIVVIAIANGSKNANPNSTTPTTDASGPPTTAARVTYSLVTVLPNTEGTGESSLAAFTIPTDARAWYLGWSYNCSNFGGSGNFIVSVDGLGNTLTTDAGVNELGASGHSVENYYDRGRFQLVVNSECSWGLKVTADEPS